MRWITTLAVVAGASVACLSLSDVDAEQSAPTALSESLPEVLAEFVVRAGTDRPVSTLSAEEQALLGAPEEDLGAFMAVLQPGEDAPVFGPLRLRYAVEANGREKPGVSTRLVAGSRLSLVDDVTLEVGDELVFDDEIRGGLVINLGDVAVLFQDAAGDDTILPPGAMMQVISQACQKSCDVDCTTGYFACCRSDGSGCVTCHCVQNGNNGNACNLGGGPGSTHCSTGMSKFVGDDGP